MTREEALQIIYDHCQHCDETEKALETLKENKGEWIYLQGLVPYKWRCNKCEKMFKTDFNFCPNCGADMRGEK